MSENLKNILLWLAVLPGSIIGGILILFPVHWILFQTLSSFIEPYPEIPEKILSPLATAWAMVKSAAYIAPSNKKIVAITIGVLWVFFAGVAFTMSYYEIEIGMRKLNLFAGGLPIFGGIVGATIGVISELKDKGYNP